MSSETDADADESPDGTTDGGYVHVPETEGDGGTDDAGPHSVRDGDAPDRGDGPRDETPSADDPTADGFGRKGWALTAVLFTCVLVIPGIIYAYPYAAGAFGLTFFATYLALPLVPALLLGVVAVWSMTAATADDEA
ncbi:MULTISPECIES: hypothetical protein [Halorubrum]|uniref:Uncharacterized protein n=1 Tax=Halorubrum hochstenium ATCC 700873 TaxID=1227481 RepID=M0FBM4_9EURY|nr:MULTISPECIES: hypothetical protein [Halorubrum]ELZ56748.1 hypothetical protein C467_07742 [Halorubrum hochstenium ATCC 700873]